MPVEARPREVVLRSPGIPVPARQDAIANELHDSTVQHLVAVSLNLMRLRADAAVKAETLNIVDEIDGSLEQAIRELSAFTYLLHPPTCRRRVCQRRSGDTLRGSAGGLG